MDQLPCSYFSFFQLDLQSVFLKLNLNSLPALCISLLLFSGDYGTGKTTSLVKMALEWANGKKLQQFDFVFFLELRHVNNNDSLVQIVRKQNTKLTNKNITDSDIAAFVDGSTGHKVILLLDGYDEYTKGVNMVVDSIIANTTGNYSLVVTTRSSNISGLQEVDTFDVSLQIIGFNDETILDILTHFQESKEKSEAVIEKTKELDIYELLRFPPILLMTGPLTMRDFNENRTQGPSRHSTGVFEAMMFTFMDKTTKKHFKVKASQVPKVNKLFFPLGKLAWESLQKDTRQNFISKVGQKALVVDIWHLYSEVHHQSLFNVQKIKLKKVGWKQIPYFPFFISG